MSGVDTFVRLENIKRYKALLARESDADRRATLQALLTAEQTALEEGAEPPTEGASSAHGPSD